MSASFWKGVGTASRRAGQALESLGLGLQGRNGYKETRELPWQRLLERTCRLINAQLHFEWRTR